MRASKNARNNPRDYGIEEPSVYTAADRAVV